MKKPNAGNQRRRLALRREVIHVFENRLLDIVGGNVADASTSTCMSCYTDCAPEPPPKKKK